MSSYQLLMLVAIILLAVGSITINSGEPPAQRITVDWWKIAWAFVIAAIAFGTHAELFLRHG